MSEIVGNEVAGKPEQIEVVGKPEQIEMEDVDKVKKAFGDRKGLLVKQTMRGCFQECLGCEAKSEFKISDLDWQDVDGYKLKSRPDGMERKDIMYAIEKSSFFMRCCWRDGRPFNMKVSEGGEPGGAEIVNFRKPCGFPLNFSIPTRDGSIDCPCCCLLPKVSTETPDGTPLDSESIYICDRNLCVPKLQYAEEGQPVYIVKPETCCGGCCISCNPCTGKGLLYMPFYFHDPKTEEVVGGKYGGEDTPQIRKVWAGLKKECCSTADTFAIFFPSEITAKRKAGLLGLTFLLDFTVFERQQDKEIVG